MDNRGFGLQETLLTIGLMLFTLVIVYIYGNRVFKDFNTNNTENITEEKTEDHIEENQVEEVNEIDITEYEKIEEKLIKAAQKYTFNKDNTTVISLNKLIKNNLIDKIVDSKNNECNGYVIYKNNNYKAYLSCGMSYTSYNYNIELEEN
jgi:hypothetical protein